MNGLRTFKALLLVAAVVGLATSSLLPVNAQAQQTTKTWVVDAVDEGGSRFVSADNGTSEITVEVGDKIRWEFDEATMGHNVRNNSPNWSVNEYRDPDRAAFEYTFTKTGEYKYICTLHNGMDGIVTVVPDAPTNNAPTGDPLVDPRSGPAPLYVHFEARATDPDGDPLTYRWDFGDGSPVASESHAHHDYTQPGNYTASLKVSDGKGGELNRSYPISVTSPGGQAPTVNASGNPTTGNAPLSVTFMANGQDPQGETLTYSWDFGDPTTDADKATGNRVFYQYTQPGTYTATVTARDPGGNAGTDTVQITVDEETPPAASDIEALADPESGEAPLEVAFSTHLTTRGEFGPLAGGSAEYTDAGGTAELSRSRDETVSSVHVEGLRAGTEYEARVHTEPCSSNQGGPVFKFDVSQPDGAPNNEIRMPLTADSMGMGMGTVEVGKRADDGAASVVVHDASNTRVACATLAPDAAELRYSWDFDGDGGADATVPDPTHTYADPGSYTARVTVSNVGGGEPVSRTVPVEVSAADAPPDTEITAGPSGTTKYPSASFWFLSSEPGEGTGFECALDGADFSSCSSPQGYEGLASGEHTFQVRAVDAANNRDGSPASRAWTVDTGRPYVGGVSPRAGSSVRDRTPRIRATVRDSQTDLARGDVGLSLDGRSVRTFSYDPETNVLSRVPTSPLSYGSHAVKVTATDEAGNTTTKTWRFRVKGR